MKTKFFAAGFTGLLLLILVFLLLNFDVAPIGPEGTRIGLSHINKSVFDFFGVNHVWYEITEMIGYAAILAALVFVMIGCAQLVKRKSIKRVDKSILALGVLYLVVIGLYVFFEVVIVNYRPVIMPGDAQPEASFPSTHTMLVCVIMGSTAMLLDKYVKSRNIRLALKTLCAAMILMTVCGRLISGVHWLTDILGGILLSATLLYLYSGALERMEGSAAEIAPGPALRFPG
jgi:undecaprenyl-diphosphatase